MGGSDAGSSWLLKRTLAAALELNGQVQLCIFDTLMNPIRRELSLPGSAEWAAAIGGSGAAITDDLPEFGLAPMEYITQVLI